MIQMIEFLWKKHFKVLFSFALFEERVEKLHKYLNKFLKLTNQKRIQIADLNRVVIIRNVSNKFHLFHVLQFSPWPICTALTIFLLVIGLINFMHYGLLSLFIFALIDLIFCVSCWFRDIIIESNEHTNEIKTGIRLGMIFFIISEIMFFFSFFVAFFYCSLSPNIEIGVSWPPIPLLNLVIDPLGIPLLNTFLLLSSGIAVTCSHYYLDFFIRIRKGPLYFRVNIFFARELHITGPIRKFFIRLYLLSNFHSSFLKYLLITIILAFFFTVFQIFEYIDSSICMSDGIYGSTFFMMTGFHGLHVFIGTILLSVSLGRGLLGHFDKGVYVGFECSIWYWHFVDVVWLFLYIFVYIWGSDLRVGTVCLEIDPNLVRFVRDNNNFFADFADFFQISFQDSASVTMSLIISLHNYIFFYLILIIVFVLWIFFNCLVYNINYTLIIPSKRKQVVLAIRQKFVKLKKKMNRFLYGPNR